jgi:hypothetical protein
MKSMATDDFPANTVFSVYVLEDADPPRELAFYRFCHKNDDPLSGTVQVENGDHISGIDEATLRSLSSIGVPLTVACNFDGNLAYGNGAGTRWRFDRSLSRWLRDHRRLRVAVLTQTVMRFDEFTPEQQRAWAQMMKKLDERAQGLRRGRGGGY